MKVFELSEMTDLLGMDSVKAKNWTSGRPFKLPASIRPASGTGRSNLYSIADVYLMGVANEFSKAGFAAMAIGRLVDAVDANRLANLDWLTVYRAGSLKYIVKEGKVQPPDGVLLWMTLNIGDLVKRIDMAVERRRS